MDVSMLCGGIQDVLPKLTGGDAPPPPVRTSPQDIT